MLPACDICDKPIASSKEYVRLHIQGVQERISAHDKCAEILLRCKGNFHKLPDGKLKRALLLSTGSDIEVRNTGIVVTRKQRSHIIEGLRKSHEEGMLRINSLATVMYNLQSPEPNEYYTLNCYSQLVLMRKSPEC